MGTQQAYAKVLGGVLLLVGILGLFVGSGTLILFNVNHPHNAVHIVSGILGLLAGFAAEGAWAKTFNRVFGVVYALVAIVGFAGVSSVVTLLNLNLADNILHTVIAIASLGVGFGVEE